MCNAATTGTEAKKVMMPWAAKDRVQPERACQGAMKNWYVWGQGVGERGWLRELKRGDGGEKRRLTGSMNALRLRKTE